jgi:hypothetical protein
MFFVCCSGFASHSNPIQTSVDVFAPSSSGIRHMSTMLPMSVPVSSTAAVASLYDDSKLPPGRLPSYNTVAELVNSLEEVALVATDVQELHRHVFQLQQVGSCTWGARAPDPPLHMRFNPINLSNDCVDMDHANALLVFAYQQRIRAHSRYYDSFFFFSF